MSFWHTKQVGDLTLYQASTMSWLPHVVQCFTTRTGGTSSEPYDSLNLSLNCGDQASDVESNRATLAKALAIPQGSMVFAEQVHGRSVAVVDQVSPRLVPNVDALVTAERGVYLSLLFADCYPIYIVEPHKKVIALAHAGWRGLDLGVLRATTETLVLEFGVSPNACQVAVGPGIISENYEVDSEVADRFRETISAGATVSVMPRREMTGKWELNLRSVIFTQLLSLGYKPESIAVCDMDTYSNPDKFFSHRRESIKGLSTGRMAGVIGLRPDST